MFEKKVGIEAEFLLLNSKNEVIIPPSSWDRDGFPLLGEIRGKEDENTPDTVANFLKRKMEVEQKVRGGNKIVMRNIEEIKLATYKKAMRQVTGLKNEQLGKVMNIYGVSIEEFSDQIIGKNNKIQGIKASCGLHIHFSCGDKAVAITKDVKYVPVDIPIKLAEVEGNGAILRELIKPTLSLYAKHELPESERESISVYASTLCKPAIEYIVKEMDQEFFERFAPAEKHRTKYRQPGFYEIKAYGFEYRSLPANDKTMAALPEIVDKAFKLLDSLTVSG